jgi:hypothetical protein
MSLERGLVFGLGFAVTNLVALALWPRRRGAIVPLMLAANVLLYALFWETPGAVPVALAMALAGGTLRANDLAQSLPTDTPRGQFLRVWFFLARHPKDPPRPSPELAPALRAGRGLALVGLGVGALLLGNQVQLWQTQPYLDDLWMAAELGLVYLGTVELASPLAHRAGVTEHLLLVEGLSPRFLIAPSLRTFWSSEWNRPVSGALRRGVFDPLGGRRRLGLGLLGVFLASGLLHGPPLLLAAGGAQRRLWCVLALTSTAFFVLHGLVCLLEGALARGRRRWLGRLSFYATFLLTLPLYPAPLFVVFGAHGRPVESSTPLVLLRWAGLL